MKKFLVSLLLVVGLLVSCGARQSPTRREAWDIYSRTYQVKVFCNGKHVTSGSAVMLGNHRLSTAKHVIKGASCLYKLYQQGEYRGVSWALSVHKYGDVALLYSPLDAPPVRLGRMWVGQQVYTSGYPVTPGSFQQSYAMTSGMVASRWENGTYRYTAPSYFGNSGGGVWDTEGRLVGVIHALYGEDIGGLINAVPYDGWYVAEPIHKVRELF